MKPILFCLLLIWTMGSLTANAAGTVSVKGYFKKNGTYVQPYKRTAPDHSFNNNWSTKGNFNPYTGKEGTKISPSTSGPSIPTYGSPSNYTKPNTISPNQLNNFNSNDLNAYIIAQKAKDIERAKYWKEKGYNFDPSYMNSYMMDQKVKDIERAKYWSGQGYDFNAEYMNSYMMDQKVKDIGRAKYWNERGYNFNPEYMNTYMMDQAARDQNSNEQPSTNCQNKCASKNIPSDVCADMCAVTMP